MKNKWNQRKKHPNQRLIKLKKKKQDWADMSDDEGDNDNNEKEDDAKKEKINIIR